MVEEKYMIWCNQRSQYFADGSKFESLEDIRQQLISYHSVDQDEETPLEDMNLSYLLEAFEWEVHDTEGNIIEVKD